MIGPEERVRLILAAVEAYEPNLLITAGHAIHDRKQLRRLARELCDLELDTAIVTEVHHDGPKPSDDETHTMYAVEADGKIHRFGRQVFAFHTDIPNERASALAEFDKQLRHRTKPLAGLNAFGLICGEINLVRAGDRPRFMSSDAEAAIMAADVVINATHDRMGRPTGLDVKRRMLSRKGEDGRKRVYVSCSNWEVCGNDEVSVQKPNEVLHTVYVAGEPLTEYDELADGAFGFIYRQWEARI